jgi:hypothetical protein
MKVMSLDELELLPPLTDEELKIIAAARPTPDADCPAMSEEELQTFQPWYKKDVAIVQ